MTGQSKRTIKRSLRRSRSAAAPDPYADSLLARAGLAPESGTKARPVVGITTATNQVIAPDGATAAGDAAVAVLARLVQEARGVPVLLPPVTSAQAVRRHLHLVDAVVFSGGYRVHPNFVGDRVAAEPYDPRKDRYEWQLLDRTLERDMPMLALGRGFILLNVFLGGEVAEADAGRVRARVLPGTLLARLAEAPVIEADVFGTQCVSEVADALTASARDGDDVVRAAEVADRAFALAMQFHPELGGFEDPLARRLFEGLLGAARGKPVA